MAIKHDEQGFLVGSKIEVDYLADLLESIRDEIKGLRSDISRGDVPSPLRDTDVVATDSYGDTASTGIASGNGLSSAFVAPSSDESVKLSASAGALPSPDRVAIATPSQTINNDYSDNSVSTTNLSELQSTGGTVEKTIASTAASSASTKVSKPERQAKGRRDSKGRFIAGSGGDPKAKKTANHDGYDDEDSAAESLSIVSAVSDMSDKLTGAITELGVNEDTDPSVKAFNEVAKPLQRGFSKIFGGSDDDKSQRWYRRFWRKMREDSKVEKKQHKEQIEILEDIEKQGKGGKGGGVFSGFKPLLSFLGTLLKILLPLKLLGALSALSGLGGLIGLPGSKGGDKGKDKKPKTQKAGSRIAGIGRGAGALVKRVPLLGAFVTAASSLLDVMRSESDSTTTRRQKDIGTGSAIGRGTGVIAGAVGGGSVGSSAGAAIGTLIFPGLGTAVGGVLGGLIGAIGGAFIGENAGDIIGAQIGSWISDIRESDIAGSIISKWNITSDFISHLWGQVSDHVSQKWDAASESVSNAWSSVSQSVSDRWEVISDAFAKAASGISEVWGNAVDGMKDAWGKVTDLASSFWGSVKDAASIANDWIADKTGVDVKKTVTDVTEAAKQSYNDAKEAVSSYVDKAKEALNTGIDKAKSAVASGVSAVGEATGISGAVRAVKRSASYATNKDELRKAMAEAGITDPTEMAMFMGQMDHESGGLTSLDESFNYSSPERIASVSRTAANKGTAAISKAMAQGPEAVAEIMYGGRMGNVNPGDAHNFRGRGFTQLTGRSNYEAASKGLGIDLVNNPDMASDPAVAAKIATWYWQDREGLSESAKAGDIEGVTKKINGGLNGLQDRIHKTAVYADEISKGNFDTEKPAASSEPSVDVMPSVSATEGGGASTSDQDLSPTPVSPSAGLPAATPSLTPAMLSGVPTSIASAGAPWLSENDLPAAAALPFSAASPVPWSAASPKAPSVSESPDVRAPLASGSSKEKNQSTGNNDVSRDLPDRRIAHVVTGAYSQL